MNPANNMADLPLYIDSQGTGPDLVLLHGWGMHGGYWQGLVDKLVQDYRVHVVDLPGHGYSAYADEQTLTDFSQRIMQQLGQLIDQPFVLMGWSLGGLIGQFMAHAYPQQISHLIMIASTPAFMQRADWSSAMSEAILNGFASELQNDYQGTLKRFLALQVRGSEQAQQSLRELRAQLFERGEPVMDALQAGLGLLREVDLRNQFEQLTQPVCLITGERDTLVPASVGDALSRLRPDINIECIAKAGHAPFLSHPETCLATIKEFITPL